MTRRLARSVVSRFPSLIAGVAAIATLSGITPARAQGPGLKSVIDEGLVELGRRQALDGSYDHDAVTTASAVLAFLEAPRHYVENDGPFLRHAIAWLAQQVDAEGRPVGVAALEEQLAVDGWIEQALATSKSPAAKEALERIGRFKGSDAVKQRGEAKIPEAEFRRTFKLPTNDAAGVEAALAPITQVLFSAPQIYPADRQRWLATMPAICADLATRFPDTKLGLTTGEQAHWTKLFSGVVIRALQAPAGFEEATPAQLAAAARALTICMNKAPKEAGGGSAPPKPVGTPRKVGDDLHTSYAEAARAGLAYLETQQKDGHFGFMGQDNVGVTALALGGSLVTSHRLGQPAPAYVEPGLDWLVSLQKKNGSIHDGTLAVYCTSAALLALTEAGRAKDKAAIAKATEYLSLAQRDEADGYDPNQDWGYGGIGYGDDLRPDLSNSQFGIEALHVAGVPASDAAMQRAILFLQRCQNFPETNTVEIERADGRLVRSGADGGAGYQPGESKAGLIDTGEKTKDGATVFMTRSYGSMTYALLKCYLFAGLPLDDPRVKAALSWIEKHWSVDVNPGFDPVTTPGAEYQGLFYYYFTMAKALDATGLETLTTADGKPHAWRDELLRKLLESSMNEGYWTNQKAGRWMEEFPTLATSYALVAMDRCLGAPKAAGR